MVLNKMTAPSALEEPAGRESAESTPEQDTGERGAFWAEALAPYAIPSITRSVTGLFTSVIPYLGLLVALYFTLRVSPALTVAVGVLTAGFLLRTYIVFHDCAHGSYLPSKRANISCSSMRPARTGATTTPSTMPRRPISTVAGRGTCRR
jgi:hypothetical protein